MDIIWTIFSKTDVSKKPFQVTTTMLKVWEQGHVPAVLSVARVTQDNYQLSCMLLATGITP